MALAENSGGRPSPFERLLDALDENDSPIIGKGASIGPERLWPRACAASPVRDFFNCGAVEDFYADSPARPDDATAEKTKKPALEAEFTAIRKQLAGVRHLDDLRRLRRHCALAVHPDRVALPDRLLAEKFMAEINAAIDRAIKDQNSVTQRP